ncbi:hypothetical protein VPNG_04662 [Cytospora leucostoma]|uniref:Uncharacterized protein n=1 Tax=Cytospora leucostoma TaxID=1230097 RepID=A0A423XAK3_9PEZI|nr:hypothetical protein VPNG_04662 [Cytospora leucostoma]
MTTTWLSTHGIGAIKDSSSTFEISADGGSGLIKPAKSDTSSDTAGWIHFTVPSPPASHPNLKAVAVDFSSQSATVDRLRVHLGKSQVLEQHNLQATSSFKFDIASSSAVYTTKGIAVSVYVDFENVASKLRFQSVAVEVYKIPG